MAKKKQTKKARPTITRIQAAARAIKAADEEATVDDLIASADPIGPGTPHHHRPEGPEARRRVVDHPDIAGG